MSRIVEKAQEPYLNKEIPSFKPGDTVKVHVRLKEGEGDKERIQPFEGVVVSRRGRLTSATFTVRRVSYGVGVERVTVHSPMISLIEIIQAGRVRRAKLYYLRGRKGKAARIRREERPTKARVPPDFFPIRRSSGLAAGGGSPLNMLKFAAMYRLCSTRYERAARKCGWQRVAGIDEVGRGSLFGPSWLLL